MKPFLIRNLKRKPNVISSYIKKVGSSLKTTADIKVMFPSRYINKGLAIMGDTVTVLSIYTIIDENDNYAVVNAPIMVELSPNMTTEVEVDGKSYTVLEFSKGDIFITNTSLIIRNGNIYELFDELFIHGNIPWYLNYEDLSNLFKLSSKYAGTNIGDNPLAMEVLASIIARDKNDKTVLFRKLAKDMSVLRKNNPAFIALLNIYYSFTSTMSKLSGSYFKDGITSALVNKETESNAVEDMIKA